MGKSARKATWRKSTAVADVEATLVETSTKQVEEAVANEAIFFSDKGAAAAAAGPKKPVKKLWYQRVLEASASVAPLSGHKRTPDAGPSVVEQKKVERMSKRLKQIGSKSESDDAKPKEDIWNEDSDGPKPSDYIAEAVTFKRVKRQTKGTTDSRVAAVEIPEPGASYNPSYEDHQNLLGIAVAEEMKAAARRRKLRRRVAVPRGPKVREIKDGKYGRLPTDIDDPIYGHPDAIAATAAAAAASADAPVSDSDSAGEKATANKKKTRPQLNKEKRHRALMRDQVAAKDDRKLHKQVNNVKGVLREIERDERMAALRHDLKERLDEERTLRPQRIGRYKFNEGPIPVLLSEELPSGLRTLTSATNPAKDRFKSFQKRNLIEVGPNRKPAKVVKRVKMVEKK